MTDDELEKKKLALDRERLQRRLRATALAAVLELRAFMSLTPLDSEVFEVLTILLRILEVETAWIRRKNCLFSRRIKPFSRINNRSVSL